MQTTPPGSGSPTLWYDLTALDRFVGNVTGIQRAISAVARALLDGASPLPARFCTWRKKMGFFEVAPADVAALLATLGRRPRSDANERWEKIRRRIRKRIGVAHPPAAPLERGDFLVNLGFGNHPERHRPGVADFLAGRGTRYVGFIYDVLPLRHPEWWSFEQQAMTRDWFTFTGRHAGLVLCCSDASRRDAQWFFDREGIAAPPLATVRLGGDFAVARPRRAAGAPPVRPRPFALYVSSLDVRKNHRTLFQVWKRLLAKHGADATPDLVCVGRPGALVDDFLAEVENAGRLGGRLVFLHGVDDATLAELYEACLFTVFPSLAEGWGIPVTESLSHGKYCVASGASSLPEVGGDLCDYHDPLDVGEAFRLIERACFDAELRAAREARIRTEFHGESWNECAAAIARALLAAP